MARTDRWETDTTSAFGADPATDRFRVAVEGAGTAPPRTGRAWGAAALVVALGLLFAACGAIASSTVDASLCRGGSSWQDTRPVEGCSGGVPLWSAVALVLGVTIGIIGVVALLADRTRRRPRPPGR